MHLCAKYGHIVMTLAISIESHECSHMMVHLVKILFAKDVKIYDYHFSYQLVHIKGLHSKEYHFYTSFYFSQIGVKAIHNKDVNLSKPM
jgi:hypothetical protein